MLRITLNKVINPFPSSVPLWHRLAKISILILEGIIEKKKKKKKSLFV